MKTSITGTNANTKGMSLYVQVVSKVIQIAKSEFLLLKYIHSLMALTLLIGRILY